MSLLALQDIFRCHRGKATGIWKLGQEPCRTIYLDSGDIVFATSTHPLDKLTHLLVERGKLTQAQMDYAMANLKPGWSIGKNLIEMGFITQRDLLDVARAQVERVVWGALGTAGEEPLFTEGALDPSVVRLPFDTPALLLNALLNLQDRERLLELLGPLNQVVVLQSRRTQEMGLAADLAKLPPLLDGTHTLRELSQQGLVEPVRLGAFVIFLREIGWARLHEMPPMDRQALDRALSPEPEPLSAPLPETLPDTVPSLFSTIEDAARPTTNLEHLSQALDHPDDPAPIPEPEPLLEPQLQMVPEPENTVPDPYDFKVQTGQAFLPTPNMELPALPEESEAPSGPGPAVTIHPETFSPLDPVPDFPEPESSRSLLAPLAVLLLVALGLAGAYWWTRHRSTLKPQQTSTVKVPVDQKPPEKPVPSPAPADPKPEEHPTPQNPDPKSLALDHSLESRLDALRRGDLDRALKQGQARIQDLKNQRWVLRLEIACQGDTIRSAVALFKEGKPDLFLVPITLRDGRVCYQVLYGDFPSQSAAEKCVSQLPSAFRAEGNRPKPFQISEIPSNQ